MKKNLFAAEAAESIVHRVQQLQAGTPAVWGKMNAVEMLWHCNSCNEEILEKGRGDSKTTVKQFLLRILALYLAPHFTKGLNSEPHHIATGKVDSTQFESQKAAYIRLIRQLHSTKKALTLTHPAFGNISTYEWGIAAYKHMDHHLRQFGV